MLVKCSFDGALTRNLPHELCPVCYACGDCKLSGPNVEEITLLDFLTNEQINECCKLYPDQQAIRDKVIAPNMGTINAKLGQENDPDYLAYLVVYAIGAVSK